MNIRFYILAIGTCSLLLLGLASVQAQETGFSKEQIIAQLDSARYLREKGKLAEALRVSVKASAHMERLKGQSHLKIRIYSNLSVSLRSLGADEDAIEQLYKCIHINHKQNNEHNGQGAIFLGSIGSYRMDAGQLDSAVSIFKRAVDIMASQESPLYHASAYNNLGLAYSKMEALDSAIIAFDKGMQLLDFNDPEQLGFRAVILENLSDVQLLLGNYAEAQALVEESLRVLSNNPRKLAAHYYQLIQIKGHSGNVSSLLNDIDSFFTYRPYLPNYKRHAYSCKVLTIQQEAALGNAQLLQRNVLAYKDSLIEYLGSKNENISEGLTQYKLSILKQ